jgi:hypothetical protein
MTTLPVTPADGAADRDGPRAAAIAKSVIAALGRPAAFLKATVRQVGGDTYRVNVVTGSDPASARIAHSFFVVADADGRVTGSTPAITRLY